jgi:hypothetical protein
VHDSRDDDDPSRLVRQRVSSFRNGDSVLRSVHVTVDDVVLAADEHSRRTLEPFGRSRLTARDWGEHKKHVGMSSSSR